MGNLIERTFKLKNGNKLIISVKKPKYLKTTNKRRFIATDIPTANFLFWSYFSIHKPSNQLIKPEPIIKKT